MRLDPLEAGIDRQHQLVRQGEARADPDIAGVRRIVAAVELGAAGVGGFLDAACPGRDGAGEIDQIAALVRIGRVAVARPRADHAADIEAQRQRAEEIVAVAVVVTGDRDEVAAAKRLIDLGVDLGLVDLAIIVERHDIFGPAGRDIGAQPRGVEIAGLDLGVESVEVIFADGGREIDSQIAIRRLGAQVDRAAGRRGGRAVDIGGAEVDVDLLDHFGIDLLAREDRIIARIVQRHAIEGQADAVRGKAADVERAAGRAIGIVVLEVDPGDLVDRVEDRLAGVLADDVFLGEDGLGLRGVGRGNAGDRLHLVARAGDHDRGFEIDRAGGLRQGRSGQRAGQRQAGGGGGEMETELHDEFPHCDSARVGLAGACPHSMVR